MNTKIQMIPLLPPIVLRSLRKEGFSQGEVDHLFSALVLPNFTYGLPLYGAVDSDLTVIQNFLDSSLPADVPWGLLLLVTHSFLPSLADVRGEKWMRDKQKQTPQDVCGEAIWIDAFERKYISKRMDIRELLEKAD